MQGAEAAAADDFLYGTLHGDATLLGLVTDVINTQPAKTALYPYVIFQYMSGIDYAAVGAFRIWTNMVYLVKVVDETPVYADLSAAVARVDALLHRASGPVADGTVWSCTREQTFRLPEDVAGRQFRHQGGLYRVYAS